jgi:hypothetical protein
MLQMLDVKFGEVQAVRAAFAARDKDLTNTHCGGICTNHSSSKLMCSHGPSDPSIHSLVLHALL